MLTARLGLRRPAQENRDTAAIATAMTRQLGLKLASMDTFTALHGSKPAGVTIATKPAPWSGKSGMTFDSVEHLLEWTITFARDLDVGLLATWLAGVAQESGRRKTTLEGQALPADKVELAALLKAVLDKHERESGSRD